VKNFETHLSEKAQSANP